MATISAANPANLIRTFVCDNKESDAPYTIDIYDETGIDKLPMKIPRVCRSQNIQTILVAKEAGKVVGILTTYLPNAHFQKYDAKKIAKCLEVEEEKIEYLNHIEVIPSKRGQGIGVGLMLAAMNKAEEQGKKYFFVETKSFSLPSREELKNIEEEYDLMNLRNFLLNGLADSSFDFFKKKVNLCVPMTCLQPLFVSRQYYERCAFHLDALSD